MILNPYCRMRRQQLCVEFLSKMLRKNGRVSNLKPPVVFSPKSCWNPRSFSQYSPKICSHGAVSKRFSSNAGAGLFNRFPPLLTSPNTRSFHSTRRSKLVLGWLTTTNGVVFGLILANVAVFILWKVADTRFMINNFTISVENFTSWRLHTLITSAFSQRDSYHILGNMVGLHCFGTSIGKCLGPQYLLKLYLTGAIAGSLFFLAHKAFIVPSLQTKHEGGISPSKIPALGASGAVYAIVVLDFLLFPKKIILSELIIPLPAILMVIIIIGQDVMRAWRNDSQICGSAHLGGQTVGVLAWLQIKKRRRPF